MNPLKIMNRKGVTPVIAVVLLMTISVAATGAAYTFIMNTQENVADSFSDRWSQREIRQKTDLNIEHIYKGSNGYAILVVRNTGTLDQIIRENVGGSTVNYWNLYVGGPPASSWSYIGTPQDRLSPSDTITINSTEVFPTSGQKEFKLVGKYGSQDSYICYSTGSDSC